MYLTLSGLETRPVSVWTGGTLHAVEGKLLEGEKQQALFNAKANADLLQNEQGTLPWRCAQASKPASQQNTS
jgi:hypothetical protein